MVASDTGGLRDVVQSESGTLFPVGDHKAAAVALVGLLSDAARVTAAGEAARRRVSECFTVDESMRQLEALIHRVIGDEQDF